MNSNIKYHLTELQNILPQAWEIIESYKVIALLGDLGAGKTTFVSALCHYLNPDIEASSPTFSLINEYHFTDKEGQKKTIFHSDWYRIRDEEEAIQAGIEDMLWTPQSISFIEWPEKAPLLLQSMEVLYIHIEIVDAENRILHFTNSLSFN